MSDSKFLKIIYSIITLLLCAFYAFGIYFLMQKSYGIGLLGLGIGLFGTGTAILLGTNFMDDVSDNSKDEVDGVITVPKNVVLFIQASISEDSERSTDNGVVSFTDDAIYLENIDVNPIRISFKDVRTWSCENKAISITASYIRNKEIHTSVFDIKPISVLKVKACEQLLANSINC